MRSSRGAQFGHEVVHVAAIVGLRELDGAAVTGFATIGGTGYAVKHVLLSNAGNGNHTLVSDTAIGVTVYGYGQYTSYWYPGGLDLRNFN